MAITKAGVLLLAPEFTSLADADFTAIMALAALEVNVTQWGARADHAGNLITAHMLTLSRPNLAVGDIVASERVGEVSRAYAIAPIQIAGGDESYKTTRYGREYLRLRRLSIVPAVVP